MKKVLVLALAAAMILSLAACGGKKNEVVGPGGQEPPVVQSGDSDNSWLDDIIKPGVLDGVDLDGSQDDSSKDDSYGGNAADTGDKGFEVDSSEPDESAEPVDKGPRPLTKDTSAGEKYIADEFFGVSELSNDEVAARIGKDVCAAIGDSAVADLGIIINMYSIEGVHRDLEYGDESYDHARRAMVVACWMFGVDYEELWANGYMTEADAQPIIDVLSNASQG